MNITINILINNSFIVRHIDEYSKVLSQRNIARGVDGLLNCVKHFDNDQTIAHIADISNSGERVEFTSVLFKYISTGHKTFQYDRFLKKNLPYLYGAPRPGIFGGLLIASSPRGYTSIWYYV